MKINCGPTPEERQAARLNAAQNWHPFFCLWPRRVGLGDCRWLETIERKGKSFSAGPYSFWLWEYRAP